MRHGSNEHGLGPEAGSPARYWDTNDQDPQDKRPPKHNRVFVFDFVVLEQGLVWACLSLAPPPPHHHYQAPLVLSGELISSPGCSC